jgi:hypothetical protein
MSYAQEEPHVISPLYIRDLLSLSLSSLLPSLAVDPRTKAILLRVHRQYGSPALSVTILVRAVTGVAGAFKNLDFGVRPKCGEG